MRIIAFITDSHEVAKILEHIGEQTSRAPPLTPTDPVPSSCDLDDLNFQYPEVPWYPEPPAPDFYMLRCPFCRFSRALKAMLSSFLEGPS